MTTQTEKLFTFENIEQQTKLTGPKDQLLVLMEEGLAVKMLVRGNQVAVQGDSNQASLALAVLEALTQLIKKQISVGPADVISAMTMAKRGTLDYFSDLYSESIIRDNKGRAVRVKNYGQRQYVQAIRKNDLTFGIGPAGTGKTFLAVAMAISALKKGDVERIVITRPAVEAGESLGFLPGDLKEKVDPYMRPIYDAMNSLVGADHVARLIERGVLEIAPLAYMRGRTLDDAFIIVDEAQNTTNAQMKMILTRLGFGSKMVVNGDPSQIDLPHGVRSGLVAARRILRDVNRIAFINFESGDVVRHPVVGLIVSAYEDADARLAELKNAQKEANN
ncbi:MULTISPECIES: PhoH family protein [Fructobacillus]|uniref:PhoH-like protein n=2 Tax=Fructobacillus TaxID=559173 RepID=A0A3F3GZC7_9LACO|nr:MULTISPECIES: PhoH family protein [Fructobacillus]CAK1242951.1 Phosphate starvation-inducible protein PhoH [Fructobacillus sp. LMG 32999]KMK53970.1 PhoH-like protein [Fructobacillus sp. EFB-N1]MCK8627084.1 PhoH family protein [Fructobacillus cardui]NLS37745.1 AAA family ATPase [Fructobacillus tropaeoli]CAK1223032.1 Phosphate starvation-inducible protein PhoH [Fructobacillus tropaeoli]